VSTMLLPGMLLASACLDRAAPAALTNAQATPVPPAADARQAEAEPRQIVPVAVVRGPDESVMLLVPVFIRDQGPFPFALDTGASKSVIDSGLVEQLGLDLTGEAQRALGVGGAIETELLEVEQWMVGEVQLDPATVATIDLPESERRGGIQGLLGSDILSRYGTITIDFDDGRLILHAGA
jgi:hypothetical protein